MFGFHKGMISGVGVGGRVALACVFKHSFDVHLIFAAGTGNLSVLTTKALPRAVQELIDWVTGFMHILYVLK